MEQKNKFLGKFLLVCNEGSMFSTVTRSPRSCSREKRKTLHEEALYSCAVGLLPTVSNRKIRDGDKLV